MRLLNFVFVLALLSVPAFAGLSLTEFTCNSQASLTVETGLTPFNCQATIYSDSAVNLTGATLLVQSPVWTQNASYTSTPTPQILSSAGSSTAIFYGLKALLSGTHTFNLITVTPGGVPLDPTSLPTIATINAVSIKPVELSKPASAAIGEQFSVGATVTVGGTLPVTATISSISGGCSLVSGEPAAKSLGTMNNDVPSATSWALVQGSGNCSFTVTASSGAYTPSSSSGTVLAGLDVTSPIISSVSASAITTYSAVINWSTNDNSTSQVEYGATASYGVSTPLDSASVKSHSVPLSGLSAGTVYYYKVKSTDASSNTGIGVGSFTTQSDTSGGSPGGPGGSSGPGGAPAAPSAVKETKTIASVVPGVPAVVNISKAELSVSEIRLDVLSALTNVSVSIEKLDSKPASIAAAPTTDGKVYKYLDISSTIPSSSLGKARIKFRVEASWISGNNLSPSTIRLNRYSSGWSKLHTSFLSSDSNYAYFESESPGFSTFAITGEKPATPAPEQPKPAEEAPAPVTPAPLAPVPAAIIVSQADIDNALRFWNSVLPQTDAAKSLLEQARRKIADAQTAFNNNEQAKAMQLLDEAKLLVGEAAGLKSAVSASSRTGTFILRLILVILVFGGYSYYSRRSQSNGPVSSPAV